MQSLGTCVNDKQEESTVACVAMVYWYYEARGRTEQEARSRRVRRVGTFIFLFSPSHPSFFFFVLVPGTFPRLMCSCKETTVLRAKNTGVTSNALLIYY